ncbi:hypothetical protein ES319_A05G152700v1 [Gossypium barbadense]|uniref:Uncharacterized protein n=1 Tax=Gossypium barbadense TaxID=3634 RepID=A0A5J5VPZ0_GOSBA|nr:hypothetical protein ES319_A05G152700v1 [Gossypium barbadense]
MHFHVIQRALPLAWTSLVGLDTPPLPGSRLFNSYMTYI